MTSIIKNQYGAIVPQEVTASYQAFGTEHIQGEFFMIYIIAAYDQMTKNKHDVTSDIKSIFANEKNENLREHLHAFVDQNIDHLINPFSYEKYFCQMAFSRSIDNFISYFKDILSEVVIKNPNILKSKEQESLEFILSFNSLKDLHQAIIEKKLESLFYKGFEDIKKYFQDRLGIELFENKSDYVNANFTIKARNIIVHNRGIVNKSFANEFPAANVSIGQSLTIDFELISKTNVQLNNWISEIDEKIASKFDLTRYTNPAFTK